MEKNKKILVDALRKLPVYAPEDKVWETLSLNLKKTQPSGIMPQLHKTAPPEAIWTNIDNELSHREKLAALHIYEPPLEVWGNIEQKLNLRKTQRIKRRTIQWLKWSSAAAAIFVLGFFIFTAINNKNNNFSYSEEWVELQDVQRWTEDDQSIEQALALICNEKPAECNTPEFREMEDELSILTQSKQAILGQLNSYDTNTEMEILLTEIELERSNLIKEMIAKTI